MSLTTREKAEHLATFRYLHVFYMETLARWVPATPEMEVKVLFGRHIWDFAQHADLLGKRAYELRAPLHFTLPPTASYTAILEELAACASTEEKLHAVYEVALPHLAQRLRRYVEATDTLQDEPSVRVVERILQDYERMRREFETLMAELPNLRLQDQTRLRELARREAAETEIVASPALATAGGAG
jgi:DNA-binding ferritin-like protein